MIEINSIQNEDCLITMSNMPDNFVDLVVTSPPYQKIRDYHGFSFDFEKIAKELYRVLKPGGVLFWVVGSQIIKGNISLESIKQAIYFVEEAKFTFHEHIIYEKSSFSFPDKVRYHRIWENCYIMVKNGKPKTFNPIEDREIKYTQSRGIATQRRKDGSLKDTGRGIIKYNKKGKRCNVWRYAVGYGNSAPPSQKIAFLHPAIFPLKLAIDVISTWSNEGDLIYDCFAGSGTSLRAAKDLNRNYIGSEISEDYCNIIKERLSNPIDIKSSPAKPDTSEQLAVAAQIQMPSREPE